MRAGDPRQRRLTKDEAAARYGVPAERLATTDELGRVFGLSRPAVYTYVYRFSGFPVVHRGHGGPDGTGYLFDLVAAREWFSIRRQIEQAGHFRPAAPTWRPKVCQYIAGDPRAADLRFCGAPVKPGSSWCEEHFAVCTRPREEASADG